MSDAQKVDFGIQKTEDGSLVQFGVVFQNGGFFPFAASRSGDYDEALAADAQPQPQPEQQPDNVPTETAEPAPAQPVDEGQ